MPTVVFLTISPGVLHNWTVPNDWNNSNNSIEVIGGGAHEHNNGKDTSGPGGGGAYSKITNLALVPASSVPYLIALGGQNNFDDGGDTWFNGNVFAGSSVAAKGGSTFSAGGQAADGIGTTRFSGGNSGGGIGGGGGGAAGPNGDGGDSVDSSGGSGDAGFGGAGGVLGSPGANGQEFDSSHGAGGGGGSGSGGGGFPGGLYGAGGGIGDGSTGAGAQGLIVITYTPASANSNECQVSGPSVHDLFQVASGVNYTWFPLHRRTK